ncbi:MAG: hypothetical protein KGI51_04825 [Rhodospirillales bacterium]|nr:hypothetical protein [Rhodospirillales bacterium]
MSDGIADDQNWTEARKLVAAATAEMEAAEKLARELAGTDAAQQQAGKAGNAAQIAAAIAELRKQAEAAEKLPGAAAQRAQFAVLGKQLDGAAADAKANKLAAAKTETAQAAGALKAIRIALSQQERFAANVAPLEATAKALAASTAPPAKTLKGKLDPLHADLAAAKQSATAGDWEKAEEQLRAAAAAAAEAERIAELRKAFDNRAAALAKQADKLPAPTKKDVTGLLARAGTAADGFDFDEAATALGNAEARIEGDEVSTLARTRPDDPKLIELVRKMLAEAGMKPRPARGAKKGADADVADGPAVLDRIVKALPDTVPPRVIERIARERFGIDLRVSGIYNEGGKTTEGVKGGADSGDPAEAAGWAGESQRSKSARNMYDMLARVPANTVHSPSLTRVERRDALKTDPSGNLTHTPASGGFYSGGDNEVVMSGRPGDINQQFGKTAHELPNPVEPGYEPVDEKPVDYFDFATVHEVGHSVDDRMGFMAAREGQAAFGGWQSYGGNIAPIVTAVTKHHCGHFADHFTDYLTDLMTGNTPAPPAAPADQHEAWDKARKALDAWHATASNQQLWWYQGQCDSVTIGGVVYQEAYKGTWVSYLAAERRKGITGYQFRAPGEWFAELYASYHCGKLKQGHPARKWLSTLSQ